MLQCPRCKRRYDDNSTFCEECGVRLISSGPQVSKKERDSVADRAERSIFFRITRVYTWAILMISILGVAGGIVYLAPEIGPFILKDTKVSAEEVKKQIGMEKGKPLVEKEKSVKPIDPASLAKLEESIYELIQLLPKEAQDERTVEKVRRAIKERIDKYDTTRRKVDVLREAKAILIKFDENERADALAKFFEMKSAKENRKLFDKNPETMIRLAIIAGGCWICISFIAHASLVLVLLAIERNTRRL